MAGKTASANPHHRTLLWCLALTVASPAVAAALVHAFYGLDDPYAALAVVLPAPVAFSLAFIVRHRSPRLGLYVAAGANVTPALYFTWECAKAVQHGRSALGALLVLAVLVLPFALYWACQPVMANRQPRRRKRSTRTHVLLAAVAAAPMAGALLTLAASDAPIRVPALLVPPTSLLLAAGATAITTLGAVTVAREPELWWPGLSLVVAATTSAATTTVWRLFSQNNAEPVLVAAVTVTVAPALLLVLTQPARRRDLRPLT
jgi:hypothetical protein